MLTLIPLAFAATAMAVDKAELDNRVRTLTSRFEAMQQRPDRRIPAENLRKAQGIVLLDRTKAGFIFAYQGGTEKGQKRTYRVQSPTIVIEFLNEQADSAGNVANHIHSAWRHIKGDFGIK